MRYPDKELNSSKEEMVKVQFKVDDSGNISSVEVISGTVDSDLRSEAVELIENGGNRIPPTNNGREVLSVKRISVNFMK